MPFAALKGFEELVEKQQRAEEAKRELCDEDVAAISEKLAETEKNDEVSVVYYKNGAYEQKRGIVTELNYIRHYITVVKEKIYFEDITDISIVRRGKAD